MKHTMSCDTVESAQLVKQMHCNSFRPGGKDDFGALAGSQAYIGELAFLSFSSSCLTPRLEHADEPALQAALRYDS